MKAVRFSKFGHPLKVVELVEEPDAALESGQVRIEVLATPINPSDVLTLSGQYGSLPKLPAVPGNEGVGRVVEVKDTSAVKVGDLVFLPLGAGTWRTHLVAPAEGLVTVPPGTDLKQASMLFVNPPTADILLREFGALKPGDWVLQNAANSAVGRYLITLAKQAGYKTLNVVRREELAKELTELGADVVLTDTDDLPERVKAATGGAKVRLAIDAVGGDSTRRLGDSLATGGTVVNYGVMSGKGPKLSAAASIFKDITLRGFWLVLWLKRAPREQQQETFGRLAKLVADGTLKTAVEGTFTLDAIQEALARSMEGGRGGKVLLTPNGPV
ncbi:zinc-dependent alcohol dehydrogenase family protein [Myxococcus faecalis]|jgi:NADPH:quinone reductase-like Zn-dependent oxidoreductase|uniref:zinc-dependent alcohol dehydrogenase family protein n=1 Tax=Myxococcus TaxID=32 RepID=UPI001CC13F10|nr:MULTISPECIES: zinc-dependent alcohol dehydrogenase family protein [unclassified Myxococcus]MBZ4395900.1 zinc-dependent alcohol dehydrogenase family protein [Myxococcus sp. AS-1-15]MBZ4407436.1 zinc-dependent alcohol dehydrogenase family protein [Myxococcus sp. XM-1-1-1]BDT31260.1 zinc-dependent alcohol dehydrogenase family protein [Myxococcus sp. MH1]